MWGGGVRAAEVALAYRGDPAGLDCDYSQVDMSENMAEKRRNPTDFLRKSETTHHVLSGEIRAAEVALADIGDAREGGHSKPRRLQRLLDLRFQGLGIRVRG